MIGPMRYISTVLLLSACLLCGCAAPLSFSTYESEDLLSIQHNEYNNYMLMVYRDALGQTRHVLRRNGVAEIVLTYTLEGNIELKTRGKKVKLIQAIEAGHVTQRINSLLQAGPSEKSDIASI